jgi:hypothetical protein
MNRDPTFRLDIRVRNNRLIRARERLGHINTAAAAKALGLCYPQLIVYESMKESPIAKDGTWKESALKIADAFYADPGDLWPEEARRVQKARGSIEVSFEELKELMGDPPERKWLTEANGGQVRGLLATALGSLSRTEREVIVRRVVDEDELSEIGDDHCLSKERIRQIQLTALRKLREALLKSSKSGKAYLGTDDDGDPRL